MPNVTHYTSVFLLHSVVGTVALWLCRMWSITVIDVMTSREALRTSWCLEF